MEMDVNGQGSRDELCRWPAVGKVARIKPKEELGRFVRPSFNVPPKLHRDTTNFPDDRKHSPDSSTI
ncbi:hypothetical protein M8818_001512 [Zalaria obscura]|uniref:Uncharacterized protein n=1 Tax=Zalaria obscura TaxID=2024903 RepID=A0ACC3SL25_9PEZI